MPEVTITATFAKVNDEERMVYGYASVAKDGDTTLVDRQGDMISEVELVKMAHRFIKGSRHGKVMHAGKPMAEVVESLVLRPEVAKALGFETFNKTAWVIGMKVHDESTWGRVKKGELKAFSIGGKGKRVEVAKDGRAGRDGDGDGILDEDGRGAGRGGGMGGGTQLPTLLGDVRRGASWGAGILGGLGAGAGALAGAQLGAPGRIGLAGGISGGLRGALYGGLIGGGLHFLRSGDRGRDRRDHYA